MLCSFVKVTSNILLIMTLETDSFVNLGRLQLYLLFIIAPGLLQHLLIRFLKEQDCCKYFLWPLCHVNEIAISLRD